MVVARLVVNPHFNNTRIHGLSFRVPNGTAKKTQAQEDEKGHRDNNE